MKKTILVLTTAFLILSFVAPKVLRVEGDINEWQKHINKLEIIRQIADESNMPNQTVKFITKSIDSLEMLIIPQLKNQIDTTKKK